MSTPKYMKQYRIDNKERIAKYNKWYYGENKECLRKLKLIYRGKHKEEIKEYGKLYKGKLRVNVLNIISNNNPICVRCGCDDIRLLEINHKDGGGGKEKRKERNFYQNIYQGRRKTDDLEVLCRVCNTWHYLELKYGELPYKVFYDKNK